MNTQNLAKLWLNYSHIIAQRNFRCDHVSADFLFILSYLLLLISMVTGLQFLRKVLMETGIQALRMVVVETGLQALRKV